SRWRNSAAPGFISCPISPAGSPAKFISSIPATTSSRCRIRKRSRRSPKKAAPRRPDTGTVPGTQKRAARRPPFVCYRCRCLFGGAGRFTRLLGLLLGFEVLAGLLVDDLHRQAHLAAIVEAE